MADPWLNLAQTRFFPRPAGTTRDAHRRYLDAEIHSLESILYDAKELRNMQSTLVSMPEEVLLEIMMLVRDAPRTIRRSPQPSQPRWTHLDTCSQCGTYCLWTSITGVCRRFSAVARCPLLYTRPDDTTLPPTLVLRTLTRSASIPLDLYLTSEDRSYSRKAKPPLESVIRQCKRIRSLTATDAIGTGPLVLTPPFRDLSIFTNMTHLALLQGSHGEPDPAFLGLDRPSEPLLDWQPPPHLESLHLDLAPFPWDNPIYNNLTELTLSNLYCDYHNAPSLTAICDLLQRMTRLQRLTLDNVDIDLGPLIYRNRE
ncbi:hypothetical protein PENSPDRAFT_654619 [Peniophora sp. CONT]|nr:hypothetical protein PENSPDRAFT_654619 [Peniophora sp. CONT]